MMWRKTANELTKVTALVIVSFFTFLPVYFMLIISVKDPVQFAAHPFRLTWPFFFQNYRLAWPYVGPYIGRTLCVAAIAPLLATLMGSLCAFYYAQFKFTGKNLFFAYTIVLMMIPGILNLIPMFVLATQIDSLLISISKAFNSTFHLEQLGIGINLRFLNTLWALIIPASAGQVMLIYVLRQFFKAQPAALFEAARIDGATRFQQYRHIALPLAKPIIATMTIINVVGLYNDYVWPLLVLQRDKYTLAVGLKFLEGVKYIEYGPLMAGYSMATIPLLILFIIAMKPFIEGLSSGAIKM